MLILQGGRVLDPQSGRDEICDIAIDEEHIAAINSKEGKDIERIDISGKWVMPGLIDMHVHLREPGEEYKETIASGTAAAAAGGFTAVACMANTKPVNDNGAITRFIVEQAKGCAARVYPIGAISHGLKGERLAEMGEMQQQGAVAFSDDGRPVEDSQLMRRAMEYASSLGAAIISHSEELPLSRKGSMNEGLLSTKMGLRGIPAAAESIMVQREIALSQLTGARVHIAHVSTAQSIALLRSAKKEGIAVTAETAPHYFTLTEQAVEGYNSHAKMSPPLRSEEDRQAICEALIDGTLDAIASDHAPHSVLEKELEFDACANGITGLESSLGLSLALVHNGSIPLLRLAALMSSNPAKILGVAGGSLAVGAPADITVIDPELEWVFHNKESKSKSKNSPFDGWQMKGRAVLCFVGGVRTL